MTAAATAPTQDDYLASMLDAVRQSAVRAADDVVIDPQVLEYWATDNADRDREPVPKVEAVVDGFITTIDAGYTRAGRQRVRIIGWVALAAFAIASVFNLAVADTTVRQNIVGPIGLISAAAFILWLWLRSKAKNRTADQQQTLDGMRARLSDLGHRTYYDRLRERRDQLLVRLGYDPYRPRGPRPEPQPFGIGHEGAERWCAQWMQHLGATGVSVTNYQGDGGIDITADLWIAQVKNYTGSVAQSEIRDLAGVASVDPVKRRPVFFTSGTYPPLAVEFANRAGMALFRYDAIEGTLMAANQDAEKLLATGM